MSTANPFPAAAPDFSDPLGLLRACHERIFQQCDRLEALSHHLVKKGVDQEAIQAAATIYRYFSTAARHHHGDEEEDLFPRLAQHSPQLAQSIQALKREHQQLDTLWTELAPMLAQPATITDLPAFASQLQQLAQAYRRHAQAENEGVLGYAPECLSRDELAVIGRSMAARRGIAPPTDR